MKRIIKNYTKRVVPRIPKRFYQENGTQLFSFYDKNINKKIEKSITQKGRYWYSAEFREMTPQKISCWDRSFILKIKSQTFRRTKKKIFRENLRNIFLHFFAFFWYFINCMYIFNQYIMLFLKKKIYTFGFVPFCVYSGPFFKINGKKY